ncbi:hypothetical protein PRIO_1728 [Paenibacillus riograndensis SBR5]|uniref:Uncharacterized protein n=1 Tax=Paenibacillus riograndensis SBR5 TaxID=1073571 RepID=A0A0E3WGU3_9BACL|nr:hypothetical protein PRIO_1728 [Paenibacillus riograndensis SBR5]
MAAKTRVVYTSQVTRNGEALPFFLLCLMDVSKYSIETGYID